MFQDPRLAALQTALGYAFQRPEPLVRALTHPSFIEERHPGGKAPRHEAQGSLEFLGDALLDYVIARYLLEQRPLATEGELTAARAAYASGPWLEARAKALGLGELVRLGRGAILQVKSNRALLEDTVEAVLGAMVVDGGEAQATALVRGWLATHPAVAEHSNPIGALGEWYQKRFKLPLPEPDWTSVGADHSRVWTCSLSVDGQGPFLGEAASKREAKEIACRAALAALGVQP